MIRRPALLVCVGLATHACGNTDAARLEVRTTLPEELRSEVEASFEEAHPDIDVRFSVAPTTESLRSLEAGGPAFDVWWGAPALALDDAGARGLLEGGWHPALSTPLVMAFDRTTVALADAPTDWIDLFHHAWYQDLRTLDPVRTEAGALLVGAMIVEALRDDDDVSRGLDWLARLHDQVDAYAVEPDDMVRALERGDALIAVMSRADAERARTGDDPWLHYRVPESGTPELVLGVGIVAGTERLGAARAFLDHLASDRVATASKLHTHWEPAAGTVDRARLPEDFELTQSWRAYAPALDTLRAELAGWLERWELEVRTR